MTLLPPALVYLAGASLILLSRRDRLSAHLAVVAAAAGFVLTLLLPEVTGYTYELLPGVQCSLLRVDELSFFAGRVFALVGLLALLYACSLRDRFQHGCALFYMGGALGVVFAGDYLTLYIFWELMALASLALVWRGPHQDAAAAGFRYILMHAAGGALLLGGIVVQYISTGSLSIVAPSDGLAFALVLIGIGVNAAFVPLHVWLPDAYPRASIFGTLFLSIFTTKTAIYLLARMFADAELLVLIGAIMAIYAAIHALFQSDIRRLLSYSIVSQLGYMVAAIGAGGAMGIAAAMSHAASDLLFKSLLFMCAGAFILASGGDTLQEMRGIGRRDPFVSSLLVLGALSLAGVPLLSGFVTKGFTLEAVLEHGAWLAWALLVLASMLTVLYMLRLLWWILSPPEDGMSGDLLPPLPVPARVAMLTHAALCLSIGILPSILAVALPGEVHYDPFGLPHLAEAIGVIAIGSILFHAAKGHLLQAAPLADIDVAYRRAGRAFVAFCTGSLAEGASALEHAFQRCVVEKLAWFARNPVRAFRILGYVLLASLARFFMPAEMAHRYEEDLERCRKGYPGDPARIWGTGYGILLVSLLFLMYLIFLFVRG